MVAMCGTGQCHRVLQKSVVHGTMSTSCVATEHMVLFIKSCDAQSKRQQIQVIVIHVWSNHYRAEYCDTKAWLGPL